MSFPVLPSGIAEVALGPFEYNVEEWPKWAVNMTRGREQWFWFEQLDVEFWYWFSDEWVWLIYPFVVGYWALLYSTQRWMEGRGALKGLRGPIATYHLLMTAFSMFLMFGIWGMAEGDFLTLGGWDRLLCRRRTLSGRNVFIVVSIFWSRCMQTLDSLFLILLKKPVPFLQLYHHSIVMLLLAETLAFGEPFLHFIGLFNTFQHAITYPYFAAKVLNIRVPNIYPKMILLVELLQMVVGLGAGLYTLQVIHNGGYCIRHPWSIKLFNFAYSTILIIIVHTVYVKLKPTAIKKKIS